MKLKPRAMMGFGVVFLVLGALCFFAGKKSGDEGDRQTEGRLEIYGAIFAIAGAAQLGVGISRDRGQAPSEVTAYPSPQKADVSELAIRLAKEHPDLYKCFSNDAVFQEVVSHVAARQLIKAVQVIQSKSDLSLRDAKVLVDKLKEAVAGPLSST